MACGGCRMPIPFLRSNNMPKWLKELGAKAKYVAPIMTVVWYLGLYGHELWEITHNAWS
jgi:predicted ferric reductase